MSNDLKNGVSMQIYRLEAEIKSLREQLKQQEEVIRELIPIAEKQMDYEKDRKHIFLKGPWPYEQYKAIIEKAKSLTTKDK